MAKLAIINNPLSIVIIPISVNKIPIIKNKNPTYLSFSSNLAKYWKYTFYSNIRMN